MLTPNEPRPLLVFKSFVMNREDKQHRHLLKWPQSFPSTWWDVGGRGSGLTHTPESVSVAVFHVRSGSPSIRPKRHFQAWKTLQRSVPSLFPWEAVEGPSCLAEAAPPAGPQPRRWPRCLRTAAPPPGQGGPSTRAHAEVYSPILTAAWLAQAPPVGIWRPGTSPTPRNGVHSEDGDSPVRMCEIKLVVGSRRGESPGICQGSLKREDVPWAAWMQE